MMCTNVSIQPYISICFMSIQQKKTLSTFPRILFNYPERAHAILLLLLKGKYTSEGVSAQYGYAHDGDEVMSIQSQQ